MSLVPLHEQAPNAVIHAVTKRDKCGGCPDYQEVEGNPHYQGKCGESGLEVHASHNCHVLDEEWLASRPAGSLCSAIIKNTLYYQETEKLPIRKFRKITRE